MAPAPRLFLPREYAIARIGEDAIVDGGPALHTFKGAAGVLVELAAQLDGTRTLDQIASELPGRPRKEVQGAVRQLSGLGLIEEASGRAPLEADAKVLGYLRRYRSFNAANKSGDACLERLRAAQVVIIGPKDHSRTLGGLLANCGVDRVRHRDTLTTESSGASLAVFISLEGDPGREIERRLDVASTESRVPWLRIVVDEKVGYADIGPLFRGERTACIECFYRLHAKPERPDPAASPPPAEFWLGLAAAEIFDIISGVGSVPSLAGALRYMDLGDPTPRLLTLARIPGCPRCRPTKAPPSYGALGAALILEDAVAQEEAEPGQPRPLGPAAHDSGRTYLNPAPKELSASPRYPLDPALPPLETGVLAPEAGRARRSLDGQDIGAITLMTAGLRQRPAPERRAQRWAATGGNLGSVDLYLVARKIKGIAPGVYLYQTLDHSLAHLDHGNAADAAHVLAAAVPEFAVDPPAAAFVFVGAFHRLAPKYGAFGYRLLQLDAGAALSQACLVADGLGIPNAIAARWADDTLENGLGLVPFSEQVTGGLALWPQGARPERRSLLEPEMSATELVTAAAADGLAHAAYRTSRLSAADVFRAGTSTPAFRAHTPGGFELPTPATSEASIRDVLHRRRSVRAFDSQEIPQSGLAAMLHYAECGDAHAWPVEHAEGRPLRQIILARRVAGLNPGAYDYEPGTRKITLICPLSDAEYASFFVQEEFAPAPAAIWVVGDLAAATARHGEFGHRQLLLRACHAGHRLWMAAIAQGMAGCLAGGMVPGGGRRLLGLDGFWSAGLLGFVFGYEPVSGGAAGE